MIMNNFATILITITLLTGGTETVYFDVPVHEVVQQKELNVEYQIAEKDINMLAKTIWNEARGIKSDMEKAAIAWCVLNRVDSTDWEFRNMNTIEEVLTAPGQIEGYKEDNPLDDHLVELAEDVLIRWNMEKDGVVDVGRVLPKDYYFWWGDGKHNHFRKQLEDQVFWDWSWDSPYEEDLNG